MFSLTIQDNHLSCRKQLRESSQLPEVLQKVREFMCLVYETKLRQPDGCRFRFSAGDRAAAQPDFPIPPLHPPGGRGKEFPRTADAVPLRSAFGLRMLFLSRHRPPGAHLTAAQPSRPRIPIGLNASHSRTDLSSVPSIPVFGTPGPVLSGQVSSKTPFYAFCVATCPNKGSLCLDLFCVIMGNTYL